MIDSTPGKDYLNSLQRFGSRLRLDPLREALKSLGNPQDSFKSIQIAGTNGKGSTAAFLSQALIDNNYKVGLYTSPFLDSFNDRIRINNIWISDVDIDRLTEKIRPLVEKHELTFFEAVTAIAFLYFAEQNIDYAVLEVGLGGRLDATTTCTPLLTIITNIALDHIHILGNSIEKIAFEKAGVIRSNTPCITSKQNPEALKVIQDICSERNAPLTIAKPDNTPLSLAGDFQHDNAACAREALKHLGITNTDSFNHTNWPGRLETMQHNPLVLMDCAHNPAAMHSLTKALPAFQRNRTILVLAIKHDKNYKEMLNTITPLADDIILTEFPTPPEPMPASELASSIPNAHIIPDPQKALDKALSLATPGDMVLVCGSIFLISQARKRYIPQAHS